MNPNNNPSRQHRPNRWTRLKKQLAQARQERAAAVSFILTIKRWDEFEQYINLTCCHDYERLERQIIMQARETYKRQQEVGVRINRPNATKDNEDTTNRETNENTGRQCNSRDATLKRQMEQVQAEADNYKARFEIEKDAKNEAYSFILANGLLLDFKEWHAATKGASHFEICKAAMAMIKANRMAANSSLTDEQRRSIQRLISQATGEK